MTAIVLFNGTETEPFTIRTGVKQGCDTAPTLFTVYLCVILFLVRDRLPRVVELDYRLDGRLFNPSSLKAKKKVMKATVKDLQYIDDCAILTHSAEELQTSLNLITEAYQSLGLHQHKKQGYPSTYSRHQCRTSRNQSIWKNPRCSVPYLLFQHVLQETAPPSL